MLKRYIKFAKKMHKNVQFWTAGKSFEGVQKSPNDYRRKKVMLRQQNRVRREIGTAQKKVPFAVAAFRCLWNRCKRP